MSGRPPLCLEAGEFAQFIVMITGADDLASGQIQCSSLLVSKTLDQPVGNQREQGHGGA